MRLPTFYRHFLSRVQVKSKQQFTDNASPNFAKQTDNYHNPNSKPQSTRHITPLPTGEGSGEGPVESASSLFIFLVSEDGASIYSASPVAREEFPNEDVTTRGAISIGRRLIDPLAELVKIDPKSIGVGQYQHDVDQSKLKHSLDQTVMSCVNQVGVNLNTASLHLLTYVSGLGPALARNIIDYRREHGPFTSRAQLKKVKRLGDTAFQQCAGFLRIPNAKNPLDNSAVHPESYHIVEQMAKDLKCTIKALIGNKKLLAEIDIKRYLTLINQPHPPISLPPLPPLLQRGGEKPPPTPTKGGEEPHPTSPKGEECLYTHKRVNIQPFPNTSAKYLQVCLPSLRRGRGRLLSTLRGGRVGLLPSATSSPNLRSQGAIHVERLKSLNSTRTSTPSTTSS